jgi:hypothetical protein
MADVRQPCASFARQTSARSSLPDVDGPQIVAPELESQIEAEIEALSPVVTRVEQEPWT